MAAAQYAIGTLIGRPPAQMAAGLPQARPSGAPRQGSGSQSDSLVRLRPDWPRRARVAAGRAFVGRQAGLRRSPWGRSAGWTAPAGRLRQSAPSATRSVGRLPAGAQPRPGEGAGRPEPGQADEAQARYGRRSCALGSRSRALFPDRASGRRVGCRGGQRPRSRPREAGEGGVSDFLQVLDRSGPARRRISSQGTPMPPRRRSALGARWRAAGGLHPRTVSLERASSYGACKVPRYSQDIHGAAPPGATRARHCGASAGTRSSPAPVSAGLVGPPRQLEGLRSGSGPPAACLDRAGLMSDGEPCRIDRVERRIVGNPRSGGFHGGARCRPAAW